MGDMQDELTMISQSATRAASLLQFYRIAFGAVHAEDAPIPRQALQAEARTLIDSGRIKLDWPDSTGPELSRAEARLLCQLLLCCRAALGLRGTVSVDLPTATALPMRVGAQAIGAGDGEASLNSDVVALFEEAPDVTALPPRLIEFVLVRSSADGLGVNLRVEKTQAALTVTAV
ncbi:MAG: histidine phosphotransferase family protein, partial [Pseudomonadota bacterium]